MRRYLSVTLGAFLALALVAPVQAGKSGGSVPSGNKSGGNGPSGRSGGNYPPSKGDNKPNYGKDYKVHDFKDYNKDAKFHDFKDYHKDGKFHDFKNYQKSFYYGKNNHFWSECRWWHGYNCYVYWSPVNYCWYYWNDFYGCYVPVAVPVVPYIPCFLF